MFFFDPKTETQISKAVWDNYVQEEVTKRAERLKEAVRIGGGGAAVARKIGMPMPTLNNYLGGRDMKASAMVLLAEASGVSLEWLATGRGEQSGAISVISAEKSDVLPAAILDAPANFYILDTCIRSCQYFFSKLGTVPTLREVLQWISNPYRQGMGLPDRSIDETDGDFLK